MPIEIKEVGNKLQIFMVTADICKKGKNWEDDLKRKIRLANEKGKIIVLRVENNNHEQAIFALVLEEIIKTTLMATRPCFYYAKFPGFIFTIWDNQKLEVKRIVENVLRQEIENFEIEKMS
jgi:hypothetical protein